VRASRPGADPWEKIKRREKKKGKKKKMKGVVYTAFPVSVPVVDAAKPEFMSV